LRSYLESFEDKKPYIIALDIEAELNLHEYGEKLCLIQIFDGTNQVIIDPLEIDNHTLKILFESRYILKIVYDASSDSSLLKNTYDIDIKSLLDLRPAVELLHYDKQDLHSVIIAELGITLTSKSKYQRHNWTKRPIDKQAIDYALNDVIYLFKLKDALFTRLYTRNLLDVFILKNLQVQNKDYARNPEDRYRNIKGYYALSDDEKGIFKRVFDVREKYAKMCNLPAYNVIKREDLLNISRDKRYIDEIRFPNRLSPDLIQRILTELKSVSK
jgi:ribonuclease D